MERDAGARAVGGGLNLHVNAAYRSFADGAPAPWDFAFYFLLICAAKSVNDTSIVSSVSS